MSEQDTTLNELFNRNPVELSDQDVQKITDYLRERRKIWAAEETSSRSQGRRARTSQGSSKKSLDEGIKKNLLDDLLS